jgi:hypothetical protein
MIDLVTVSSARTPELAAMTKRCVDSFRATCNGKIIVVEEFDSNIDCTHTVITQTKPFCYNKCLNDGFKHTTADWICFANNDVEFMPSWYDMIRYDYDSMSPLNPGWMYHKEFKGDPVEGFGIGVHLTGWCIVAKRETIEKIGGFDEGVDFWCSDNIYAIQLDYHGLKHYLIPESHVKHVASRTLFKSKDITQLTKWANRKVRKS